MSYLCVRYQEQECGAQRIFRCNPTKHAQVFLYQQQKEYVVCGFPKTLPLEKSHIPCEHLYCVLPDVLIKNIVFISITRNLCVCVSRLSLRVASVFYTLVAVNCMSFSRFCQQECCVTCIVNTPSLGIRTVSRNTLTNNGVSMFISRHYLQELCTYVLLEVLIKHWTSK